MGTRGNKRKKSHGEKGFLVKDEKHRREMEELFRQVERERQSAQQSQSPAEDKPPTPITPANALEHYRIIYSYSRSLAETTDPRPTDRELARWSTQYLIPAIADNPGRKLIQEKEPVPVLRVHSAQTSAKESIG